MNTLRERLEAFKEEMRTTATGQSPSALYWADRLDAILSSPTPADLRERGATMLAEIASIDFSTLYEGDQNYWRIGFDRILSLIADSGQEEANRLRGALDNAVHEGMRWKERAEKAEALITEPSGGLVEHVASEALMEMVCCHHIQGVAAKDCGTCQSDARRIAVRICRLLPADTGLRGAIADFAPTELKLPPMNNVNSTNSVLPEPPTETITSAEEAQAIVAGTEVSRKETRQSASAEKERKRRYVCRRCGKTESVGPDGGVPMLLHGRLYHGEWQHYILVPNGQKWCGPVEPEDRG